jgi:hypothetical protein
MVGMGEVCRTCLAASAAARTVELSAAADIRLGVKEQVLGASDRAALQSLIPLAGALGAGTIFALFFGGRRKTGFAVFEVFAIVAVLTAVGTTAYFCVALLHQDQAISDRELAETATPLIVAVFLLVFVSIISRLQGSFGRAITILPLVAAGAVLAALLTSSSWAADPEDASLFALGVLGVGALLALIGWGGERLHLRREGREQVAQIERLARRGYLPEGRELRLATPLPADDPARPVVHCWRHKERLYVDLAACERLREEVGDRWQRLSAAEAQPPVGAAIVFAVAIKRSGPWGGGSRAVRITALALTEPRQHRIHELAQNDDGLFDVTGLGVV